MEALALKENLFLDIIRMICYRAETRMIPLVDQTLGNSKLSRRLLKSIFRADAEIIPEPDKAVRRVRLLGIASNRTDVAIAAVFDELNKTKTVYPGTTLRREYEIPK